MPVISKPYYLAKCDGCGREADDTDYGDYTAFGNAGQAEDEAIDAGWTSKGDVLHCQSCPALDDDEPAPKADL